MNTRSSILCLNDWEIRNLLLVVAAAQLAVLAFLGIDSAPSLLSLTKVVLGSIYVAVIPGALLLRILRLHDLGTARTLVYTVCLSLAFALLLGFAVNASYPSLGIARPLSPWPIVLTYSIALPLLSIIAYFRDRDYRHHWQPVLTSVPWFLFFLCLPLAATLGAELVNSRGDNTVLMVLLPVLALIPIVAVWSKIIPEDLYPWVVFTVAVSVLLHVSQISTEIAGLDTQIEYRVFELAEERSVWESTSPANTYNSTLSVTILPVLISRLTGLEGIPIFKIVFPVLVALVPLAMYELLRQYISRKWALLAVFLLMFQYAFYFTMPLAAKQSVGWVFMAAMMLTLGEKPGLGTTSLRVAFLLAMVVSHYATAYLGLTLLAGAVAVLAWRHQTSRHIGMNLAVLAVTVTIGWYMYSAGSTTFDTFARLGEQFVDSLTSGFTDPGAGYATSLVSRTELSLARLVLKYMYVALQALIGVGLVAYLWRWVRQKPVEFPAEFMALSAVSFGLFCSTAGIPYLATFADLNRLFTLPVFFLAPFVIAGVATILGPADRIRIPWASGPSKQAPEPSQRSSAGGSLAGLTPQMTGPRRIALAFMALFVAVLFLFGSGFVSEIAGEKYPLSFAVSGDRMHAPVTSDAEVRGAEWLFSVEEKKVEFYHDFYAWPIYLRLAPLWRIEGGLYFGMLSVTAEQPPVALKEIPANAYVYLSAMNIKSGELALAQTVSRAQVAPRLTPIEELPSPYYEAVVGGDVIFDNGRSRVLLSP